MEHIEELIEQFSENHPVWFWVLVRLTICFCWMFVVVVALLALVGLVAPFFGASLLLWMLVPVLIVVCWGLGTIATYMYTEFVGGW